MTKNKFFRGAIGRPAIQSLLKQIYESKPGDPGLERLLMHARSFAQIEGLELSTREVYELVKNARGDELAIVLDTYEGEVPLSCSGLG